MSAQPSVSPFPLTGYPFVDVITTGFKWNLDSSRTVNWSLSNGFYGEFWTDPTFAASTIKLAFDSITSYANIKFNYVGYFQSPKTAADYSQINLSLDGAGVIFGGSNYYMSAYGFFPTTLLDIIYPGQSGDMYLNINSSANYLPSYAPGSKGFALLLHEMGHSLGLKHTHDNGGTGRPTFADLGLQELDHDWFSMMSYQDDNDWNQLAWNPATPMALDVLGLMALYGPNYSTNSGDNTYLLSRDNLYSTWWDASGKDTISCAQASTAWTIDLQMDKDSLLGIEIGLACPSNDLFLQAPSTIRWLLGKFENISGSAFGDMLTGNDGANLIYGNGGNDTIDGGRGVDTAAYIGFRANHTITRTSTGWTVAGGINGTDSLSNIERVAFDDKTVALDIAGNAGQAYRLYQAAFNRRPDNSGLKYWIGQIDNGTSLQTAASAFISSAEFQGLYGSNPSAGQLITLLYNNVLHRAPDTGGYDYWISQFNAGTVTKTSLLVNFSESAENQAAVIGAIQNGIELL